MNNQPEPRFKNNLQKDQAKEPVLSAQLRQKRRHRKNRMKNRILAGAAVLVLVLLFFFSPLFKVRQITIRGVSNSNLDVMRQTAAKEIGQHILFYGKNELISGLKKDPFVEGADVSAAITGNLEIAIHEYSQDYALLHEGTVYKLNRTGLVLGTGYTIPPGVTELKDDTAVLAPGNTMYGDGAKKTIMTTFSNLMAQNTSLITFQKLDLQDPANITLESSGWIVELGSGDRLQNKLNQAINILKSVDPSEAPGIIDLRFDAPPVIRKKGGA